jgi:hypothetical protein
MWHDLIDFAVEIRSGVLLVDLLAKVGEQGGFVGCGAASRGRRAWLIHRGCAIGIRLFF